jgi:hypothetical protein
MRVHFNQRAHRLVPPSMLQKTRKRVVRDLSHHWLVIAGRRQNNRQMDQPGIEQLPETFPPKFPFDLLRSVPHRPTGTCSARIIKLVVRLENENPGLNQVRNLKREGKSGAKG